MTAESVPTPAPRPNPLKASVAWFQATFPDLPPDVARSQAEALHRAVYGPELSDVHTRNANLRSEHRQETAELAVVIKGLAHAINKMRLDLAVALDAATSLPWDELIVEARNVTTQWVAARAEVERLTEDNERLGALYGLAERQYGEVTGELRADLKRYEGALDSAQRGLIRMETQRDDLRLAVLQAAGVDPDTANEDTDYAAILTDLRAEVARLSAESLTIPDDAAAQLLLDAALEYQTARDIEDPEHNIDDAYYLAQAAFQARKLREAGWGAPARPDEAAAQIEAVIAGVCTGQDDANGHIIYFIDDVGSPADVAQLVLKLITSPGWGSAVTNPTGAPAAAEAAPWREVGAIPADVNIVIGGRSKRLWYRRHGEQWMTLEEREHPLRLVSEHSLFALEGEVSSAVLPAPSPAGDATPDTEAREFAEDMHHQATFRPVLDT